MNREPFFAACVTNRRTKTAAIESELGATALATATNGERSVSDKATIAYGDRPALHSVPSATRSSSLCRNENRARAVSCSNGTVRGLSLVFRFYDSVSGHFLSEAPCQCSFSQSNGPHSWNKGTFPTSMHACKIKQNGKIKCRMRQGRLMCVYA